MFLQLCVLALLPIELGGQGKQQPWTPKQPKIAEIVTDRTDFALSPNFGDVNAYSINQAGDSAFTSGSNALFGRPAGAASPTRLLQVGDPAPGFADSRVDLLTTPIINGAGHIAAQMDFNLTFGTIRHVIYVWDGVFHRVAYSMDPAPGGGGAAFGRGVSLSGFNDSGLVAFSAPLIPNSNLGLTARTTLYVTRAGATPTRSAGPGDVAPGPGGGTLDGLSGGSLNSAGEVMFNASVVGGNGGSGVFVATTAGIRKVISHGDALPAPLVGTFDFVVNALPACRFNNGGEVAFAYLGDIFVVNSGGTVARVFDHTGPVPPPLTGAFRSTGISLLAFNDNGQIVFTANTDTGLNNLALLRHTPGNALEIVAYRNLSAPGTGGALFNSFGGTSMNAGGVVTFYCSDLRGGTVTRGIFQQSPGGGVQKVVVDGDATPLGGGGTFGLALSGTTRTLDDGAVLFFADVLDGVAYAGTFLARGTSITGLTSTEDVLPAGARVSLRTFAVGTSGSSVVFRALRAGGQETLWLCDLRSGRPVRVMADGDPIPGMAGRLRNSTTSMMKMNANGDVAFIARLVGGPGYPGSGIFVRTRAGVLAKVVAQGDLDSLSGRTFTNIGWNSSPPEPFNNSAQVAFRATLSGSAPNPSGVFVGAPGAAPTTIAVTAPGSFTGFNTPVINNAGQVAFRATTAGGSGFYVATPGSAPTKVVASSDPGPGGSTFPASMPGSFAFNDLGELAFVSPLNGGPGGGVFVATVAGGVLPVALNGLPAPAGGSFSIISGRPDVHTNGAGDVVFRTDLTGGSAGSGLFLKRRADGVVRIVALQGQAAPDTSGVFPVLSGALNSVPGEAASLTPQGEVWMSQSVHIGDEYALVHFRFTKDNQLEKVFARGDKAPQSNGGTIAVTIQVEPPGVDPGGRYCFFAGIIGDKVADAIYVTR